MHLCWSHGKDSEPWGSKSLALAEVAARRGLALKALDYRGAKDPDERVRLLREHLSGVEAPIVLAGSSMGGYVSATVAREVPVRGLFLLAPALYLPGYRCIGFPGLTARDVEIVHGWRDDVVPVENVQRFARIHQARLHVLDADHRLHEAMDAIALLFDAFILRMAA